jgi:pimeloyl-ACP methyl ester carboxylesterase
VVGALSLALSLPSGPHDAEAVTAREVHFTDGDHRLAGTLFLPREGRGVALALVLGSGAQDRAYGGAATALARHFARRGYACLTWDRPGVGRSTGDYRLQTYPDRAAEALAAVRYLRGLPGVRRVGLWGHSQGGAVAPLAAAQDPAVAFLLVVAGWQGPAWQQDPVRVAAELRVAGFPDPNVAAAVAFARQRMELIRGDGPYEELERAQAAVRHWPRFRAVHWCDRALFHTARLLCGHNPAASWARVRCPVLAVYGGQDASTGPPLAVIRRGLGGGADLTVRIFPAANHAFVRSGPPGPPGFEPGYLDALTDWLDARCAGRGL